MRVNARAKERFTKQGRAYGFDMLSVGKLAIEEIYDQTKFMLDEMLMEDDMDGVTMMRKRGKVTDVERRCIEGLDWLSEAVCGKSSEIIAEWVRWINAFSRRFLRKFIITL